LCEGREGKDFPVEADVRSRNGDNDPDWPSQCSLLQMRWSKAGQIHSAIFGVAPHVTSWQVARAWRTLAPLSRDDPNRKPGLRLARTPVGHPRLAQPVFRLCQDLAAPGSEP